MNTNDSTSTAVPTQAIEPVIDTRRRPGWTTMWVSDDVKAGADEFLPALRWFRGDELMSRSSLLREALAFYTRQNIHIQDAYYRHLREDGNGA